MKHNIALVSAAALTLVIGGCIMSGQTTFTQPFDAVGASNTTVTKIPIDLSDEPDWRDHKDDIKSVDELSVVAIIANNLAAPVKARLYLSNNDALATVDEVETEGTIVFESPAVPASGELTIHWPDGFKYVKNRPAIEKEIFGDGIFWLYVVADDTPFSVDVKGEVVITITAGE